MREAGDFSRTNGPHQGQPIAEGGAPLSRARAAVILVHGRGASARSMLSLADALAQPDVAFLAPQAAGYTWYPNSFLAPLQHNEPALSSALEAIADLAGRIEEEGTPRARTVLLGFSQGACLALEFAARHAHRYGGVIALSGGLIGKAEKAGVAPPDDKLFSYTGRLDGTPVFLGCSDVDAHIPLSRVQQSAEVFRALGGTVTERIYPGLGHTINADEIKFTRALLASLVEAA